MWTGADKLKKLDLKTQVTTQQLCYLFIRMLFQAHINFFILYNTKRTIFEKYPGHSFPYNENKWGLGLTGFKSRV